MLWAGYEGRFGWKRREIAGGVLVLALVASMLLTRSGAALHPGSLLAPASSGPLTTAALAPGAPDGLPDFPAAPPGAEPGSAPARDDRRDGDAGRPGRDRPGPGDDGDTTQPPPGDDDALLDIVQLPALPDLPAVPGAGARGSAAPPEPPGLS